MRYSRAEATLIPRAIGRTRIYFIKPERATCAFTHTHIQNTFAHTHTHTHVLAYNYTQKDTENTRFAARARALLVRSRVYAPRRSSRRRRRRRAVTVVRTRLNTAASYAPPTRRTCTRWIGRRPGHVSNRQRAAPGPRRSFRLAKILHAPRSPSRTRHRIASSLNGTATTDLWTNDPLTSFFFNFFFYEFFGFPSRLAPQGLLLFVVFDVVSLVAVDRTVAVVSRRTRQFKIQI